MKEKMARAIDFELTNPEIKARGEDALLGFVNLGFDSSETNEEIECERRIKRAMSELVARVLDNSLSPSTETYTSESLFKEVDWPHIDYVCGLLDKSFEQEKGILGVNYVSIEQSSDLLVKNIQPDVSYAHCYAVLFVWPDTLVRMGVVHVIRMDTLLKNALAGTHTIRRDHD